MSEVKPRQAVLIVLVAAIAAVLSCGLPTKKDPPSITINFPSENTSVKVGESIEIVSTASAEAGISRVELSIDGQVVNIATPPSGNPTTFAAIQPWTPDSEGEVTISVMIYDVEGTASEPASITLMVSEAEAEVTVTPTEEPTITPTPEPPTEVPCTLDATFKMDVTIPDNTELAPGTDFTKIWRVTNSGTCDWLPGVQLVYASGDQLGGPPFVTVTATSTGSTVDISLDLTAPAAYGGYTGIWRIRADDGTVFGPHLTVTIIVPEPATVAPTFTPSQVPSATPTHTPTPPEEAEIQQVYNQISIPSGEIGHAVVSCPNGSVVTAGGFAVNHDILVYNQSKSGNGWQVYGKNNAASSNLLNVYAVCISNSGDSSSQILDQVTAPAGGIGHGVASCPADSVVTGGGWATNSAGTLVVYNSSKFDNGWQIYAKNTSGSSKLLNAYAICLTGTSGTTSHTWTQVSISAGETGSATGTCGNGTLATGGGFAASSDLYIYNTSMAVGSNKKWTSYAINSAGSSKLLNGYAVCISFP